MQIKKSEQNAAKTASWQLSSTGTPHPQTEESGLSGKFGLHRGSVKGLFEQHYASLIHFLVKKLGSEQEAQDVAQEAFAKLLGLDDDKVVNHLQSYLFRIANNLAIDRLRQKKRLQALHEADAQGQDISTPSSGLEDAADARRRLAVIQKVLAELPPKCRLAFLLYKFESMSYQDIGKRMNLTESMVRKYVLRAIRFCAERLEAEL